MRHGSELVETCLRDEFLSLCEPKEIVLLMRADKKCYDCTMDALGQWHILREEFSAEEELLSWLQPKERYQLRGTNTEWFCTVVCWWWKFRRRRKTLESQWRQLAMMPSLKYRRSKSRKKFTGHGEEEEA